MPAQVTCTNCRTLLRVREAMPLEALTCPRCLAPLGAGTDLDANKLPPAQRDVRRDLTVIGCGLAALGFLGAVGIAVFLGWAAAQRSGPSEVVLWGALFALIGLLGLVGGGLLQVMLPGQRMHAALAVVLTVLIILLTAVALFVVCFVVFFLSCTARGWH